MVSPTDLFDAAEQRRREAEQAAPDKADRIREEFEAFDREHPEVYERFCDLVQQLRTRGHKHYSADGILHVIRFHTSVNPKYADRGDFKINNNFTALYARKWQASHPACRDFFETRRRGAASRRRQKVSA